MKLIQSKAELLTQEQGLPGIYKMIELAGRTCYKSEDKITADSAKDFVEKMIVNGHTAMLEHGTFYLRIPTNNTPDIVDLAMFFMNNSYSKVAFPQKDSPYWHVTTNFRVILEYDLVQKILPFICTPMEYHHKRITMRFITSIGISRELIRHRVFSFANESTRYCNYTNKEKFGGEITFIKPYWFDDNNFKDIYENIDFSLFLQNCESNYNSMIMAGTSPQQAREVLPLCTKSELVMTGFVSDWKHFFDLRYFGTTGKPHPDMLQLTTKAKAVLEEAGLWDTITNS